MLSSKAYPLAAISACILRQDRVLDRLLSHKGGFLYNNRMIPRQCNILIWLPNWIGDVVMATPLLAALRKQYEHSLIRCVGKPAVMNLLSGGTLTEGFIADETSGGLKLPAMLSLSRRIAEGNFDIAVLLPNSFRSAAIARLAGVRRIVGYSRDARGWLLSDRLSPKKNDAGGYIPVPMIEYYNAIGRVLGADATGIGMHLPLSDSDDRQAGLELESAGHDQSRPLVMLNPGAAFGSSKLWPAESFAAVGDLLTQRHGAQIIVNAAPSEQAIAARVTAAMKCRPLMDFSTRTNTLGLLKGLLARCSLLITNDTGARHVGVAMGSAVVTVFGSTDPAWTTLDYPLERIVRTASPCAPCQKKICRLSGPGHHQCMRSISVDEVLSAGEELLRQVAEGRKQ